MKQFLGLLFVAAAVFFATLPTDKQHIATAANTCVVTFDGNGGTPSQSTKTVTVGGTYGTLPTASRTGYTFLGWYTSTGSAGTPVVSTTKVESPYSHKIYAKWKANTVTVSFNNNGGYGNVPSQTYTIGSTYGSLPSGSTAPAGYYFVGWFTSASGGSQIYGSTTVSASYTTLYAHYERCTYTIYFDADGGSASFSSKYLRKSPECFQAVPYLPRLVQRRISGHFLYAHEYERESHAVRPLAAGHRDRCL